MKVFKLDRYVVKRDAMGNVLEIITKESVSSKMLPFDRNYRHHRCRWLWYEEPRPVYTLMKTDKGWEVYQEVAGMEIPKSRGKFKTDESPFIPLRFTRVDGEDYGRGYVEFSLVTRRALKV